MIGAEPTGFKGSGRASDDVFPDNAKSYGQTGMTGPGPKGEFQSFVEIQYTVTPNELMADVGKVFRGTSIRFAFHREKRLTLSFSM